MHQSKWSSDRAWLWSFSLSFSTTCRLVDRQSVGGKSSMSGSERMVGGRHWKLPESTMSPAMMSAKQSASAKSSSYTGSFASGAKAE